MGRLLTALAACFVAAAAQAAQMDFSLDLRAAYSDGERSFLDGGLGKLRVDEDDGALHLGRLRASLAQPIGERFFFRLDASAWGDRDDNAIDLTEAYFEYRPVPVSAWRTRVRAGAFYPMLSLENRAAGWESPYTLSSSALNTWLAEEIRTVGIEGRLEWLGSRLGHPMDLEFSAAVFGWNDPAGVLLATHGFALHDRQTTLFGAVGRRDALGQPRRELFHEIDGRAGVQFGAELRWHDRLTFNAFHYDNHGDPTRYDAQLDDFAWLTRFRSAGVRLEGIREWTFIAQWLDGDTHIQPAPPDRLSWYFDTAYALVSRRSGRHMMSARFDDFTVRTWPAYLPPEDGTAWTLAYVFEPSENWRMTLEWLRVSSDAQSRPALLGSPAHVVESKLELGVRYAIGAVSRGRRLSIIAHANPARPSNPNIQSMGK